MARRSRHVAGSIAAASCFGLSARFSHLTDRAESSTGTCIEAKCAGFHKARLVSPGDWHTVNTVPPPTLRTIFSTMRYLRNIEPQVTVKIADARELEAREGLSKRDFFNRYGFVLLKHKSQMTAQDWTASAPRPLGLENITGEGMPQNAQTPLSSIYAKEVEQLIRQLLPDAGSVELDPLVVRRGPGTPNPHYNFAPHQDYGFTVDDWPHASTKFLEKFHGPDVKGFAVLNFWRPVLPMTGPVQRHPLAVCDPRSVNLEDIVPINVRRDEKGYSKMMDLVYDQGQQWYYYPDMTVDEVLVFKSFEHFKHQEPLELRTCFHTAFEHPAPPPSAEPRQSCEYRARIWF